MQRNPNAISVCRTVTRRCGFTLIELIAVVSLVGILSVTAVVSLAGTAGVRTRAAARVLAKDLNFARERAITTGNGTWVTFAVGSSSYSLLSENPSAPGRFGAVTMSDPATGQPFVVRFGQRESASVSIQSVVVPGGGSDIGFDWLGRPLNSSGARFTTNASISLNGSVVVTVSGGVGLATAP